MSDISMNISDDGTVNSVTESDGDKWEFEYDSDGRVTKVTFGTYIYSVKYTDDSYILTDQDGIELTVSIDSDTGRALGSKCKLNTSDTDNDSSCSISYDGVGNPIAISDSTGYSGTISNDGTVALFTDSNTGDYCKMSYSIDTGKIQYLDSNGKNGSVGT